MKDAETATLPMQGEKQPSLELFMTQLAELTPRRGVDIFPKSDLIEDLGFDSGAFSRLVKLLYERYGIGGLSTGSMRSTEPLTVEGFFRHCVVEVLGLKMDDENATDNPIE